MLAGGVGPKALVADVVGKKSGKLDDARIFQRFL